MKARKSKYLKCSMRKWCVVFLCVLAIISTGCASIAVSAQSENLLATDTTTLQPQSQIGASGKYTIKQVANEMFGDVNIKKCEYLYNLDDSADYIYVEFDGAGYAVFLKGTMELLEYSTQGKLDYSQTTSTKYYGGPGAYFVKANGSFVDALTK